jgi:phosphatidylglycerol---prolipoprotein diacylglyceryl transferase
MNPILFESSIFTIYSLWFFACLGLFVGIYLFTKLAQKSRLRLQFISDISLPLIVWSLVIGRIFTIIGNAQYYFYDFGLARIYQMIAIWQDKEISFWGAILGAIYIFIKKANQRQENIQKWADVFAVSFLTAVSIGNLGAYFDGINHGKLTDLPFGVVFQNSIVIYTEAIHPTQIYAMIYAALLAIFCYTIFKRYKNQYDGLTYILGLSLFSTFRFLEGFFRGDLVPMLWKIRFPELCFFILMIYGWHKLYYYQKKNNVPFLRKFDYYYSKMLNTLHIKSK